jgi:hypothetical protein
MIGTYTHDIYIGWQCRIPLDIIYTVIPGDKGDNTTPPLDDEIIILDYSFNYVEFGESRIPAEWFWDHDDWKEWIISKIDNEINDNEDLLMDIHHYAHTEP